MPTGMALNRAAKNQTSTTTLEVTNINENETDAPTIEKNLLVLQLHKQEVSIFLYEIFII